MIQVQLTSIEYLSAVLTRVLIALEHIMAGGIYFLFLEVIEQNQFDHARNPDFERNGRDHFRLGGFLGKNAPTGEIVGKEIIVCVNRDDLGVAGIKQSESAACGTDIDRLPQAIKHQHLTVK